MGTTEKIFFTVKWDNYRSFMSEKKQLTKKTFFSSYHWEFYTCIFIIIQRKEH